MKPARPFGYIVVHTLMLWLTVGIASILLWPIYLSPQVLVMIVATILAGTAVAVLGALFRWTSFVMLLVTFGTFLVLGVPLAVPSRALYGVLPSVDGLVELLRGVALGWKQLLTITLPVGSYEALLVPSFVTLLLATVVGLTVALRAPLAELAVLAPATVFLMAIAFGPTVAAWPTEISLALLAAILLWLISFRWYRRRAAIRLLTQQSAASPDAPVAAASDVRFVGARTVLAASVILAIASGAAIAATAALPPEADRTVLRSTVTQPFDPRDYASPLASFRRYWQPSTADSVLFTVNGLPEGSRIRVATLDTYDGIVYAVGSDQVTSESGSFTRVPYRFDQSDVAGEPVSMTVLLARYSGVWVPTVGQFQSVDFGGDRAVQLRDAFYYNDTSGTAAVIGGVESGDSYTLQAVIPRQPDESELSSLVPGPASVPTPSGVSEEIATALDEYVGGVEGQGPRLVAMLDGLREDGYISHGIGEEEPPSRSGHAADRITELFTEPRMIGDAEQYAVTAALMAREIGFPSRVVFGFVPDGNQVLGRDVSAWIEVHTAQFGWVAIDPNPEIRPIPEELPEEPAQVARPQTIVPPPVVESERTDRQTTPETQEELPDNGDPFLALVLTILTVAGWTLLVVALLLSPFLVVIAAKLRRRRLRKRAPGVVDRISGGWQEFEDAVIDRGLAPPPAATRSEVASTVGFAQSHVLAAVADRAVFAPGEPDPAEADKVWRSVEELVKSLDRGLTRWQRIKARVSLRSLGGYSVPKLFKR